jgi:hypothetical protein
LEQHRPRERLDRTHPHILGIQVARYTLIYDERTGKLLEADQTLTGNPGKLDVAEGAILAYTTFLASGYVANTTTRPPGAALP